MSKCKKCHAVLKWGMSPNGKWIPMDLNGTCHFDTCPHAKEFRGKHYGEEMSGDYTKIGRHKEQKGLDDY